MAVEAISRTIKDALKTAEAAGYRVDLLLGPVDAANEEAVSEADPYADAAAEFDPAADTETVPDEITEPKIEPVTKAVSDPT
jgi:hypothetical protein